MEADKSYSNHGRRLFHCKHCDWSTTKLRFIPTTCPRCKVTVAPTPNKIPRWVRLLQKRSKPQDIGLGATVKRIAAKFGGEIFKKFATKIGIPCGCTEREKDWDRLYPNPNYVGPTNGQE